MGTNYRRYEFSGERVLLIALACVHVLILASIEKSITKKEAAKIDRVHV